MVITAWSVLYSGDSPLIKISSSIADCVSRPSRPSGAAAFCLTLHCTVVAPASFNITITGGIGNPTCPPPESVLQKVTPFWFGYSLTSQPQCGSSAVLPLPSPLYTLADFNNSLPGFVPSALSLWVYSCLCLSDFGVVWRPFSPLIYKYNR